MTTLLLCHDECLAHDPGVQHVEVSARLRAVIDAIGALPGTEMLPAPLASEDQVLAVHDSIFWQAVTEAEPVEGRVALDPDTFLSPGSIRAALRASGAACFAIDQLFAGKARNAFCATRPPGHHAESDRAMGFCLLNHVAIAARHALEKHPVDRVAILDFDVHHGNGTQEIFFETPEVQYVSSHQVPLYPGTGFPDEVGCGNILNLPLPPGTAGAGFRRAWKELGLPAMHAFEPDLVLVSAGFDAHRLDPLAQMMLEEEDYAWITREICDYAGAQCAGRVVSVLEGGYDLEALAASARVHVEELARH